MKKLLLFVLIVTAAHGELTLPISSFNTGQVSPLLEARLDYEKYSSACRILENMQVSPLGPAIRRPGTKYIAEAKTGAPILISFDYSVADVYPIEVGDEYLRFYRNGGQILDSGSPYEIATVFQPSELRDIRHDQVDNMMYIVDGNDPPQILTRNGHTDWTIADVDITGGPFSTENDTAGTLAASALSGSITITAASGATPFDDPGHVGSLWRINHRRPPLSVSGSFAGDGSSVGELNVGGAWDVVTHGTWTGSMTVEKSNDLGVSWEATAAFKASVNDDNLLYSDTETEIGWRYRITMSNHSAGTATYTLTRHEYTHTGIVEITAVASSTSATATVIERLGSTDATTLWSEGAWSDFRGWPKTVAFHQQRLVFAGSRSYPILVWFSETNGYTNFLEGTEDTDPFTIGLQGQNTIQWLVSDDYLLIGTSGSTGRYGAQGEAVTPTSPAYQEQSPHGSASLQAVRATDTMLYAERGAVKIRDFGYSLQYDRYVSPDLTLLAGEINKSGIVDMDFQLRPGPVLWCILDNGDITTMTYQKDQSVIAWSEQNTDGLYTSLTIIPDQTGEDQIWVTVGRAIQPLVLLEFEGEDGDTFTSDSTRRHTSITFRGDAQIDTAQAKFGNSSLLLANAGDAVYLADSADWDVVADTDDYTVDLYARHTSHATTESYISQAELSPTTSWTLYHKHGTGLTFRVVDAGSEVLILAGGEITDSAWHHIALCKVGTEYGLYLDGTQVAYVDDASTIDADSFLFVGNDQSFLLQFLGHLDEVQIHNDNLYTAAPDVGLTDTITPSQGTAYDVYRAVSTLRLG